jgi:hypothetical protein
LAVDDETTVQVDHILEKTPVIRDDLAVALLQPVLKLGRAFDVSEQQGDRAARKLCHTTSVTARQSACQVATECLCGAAAKSQHRKSPVTRAFSVAGL